MEATLIAPQPEAGELRGCVPGPVEIGEGVLSVTEDESARDERRSME